MALRKHFYLAITKFLINRMLVPTLKGKTGNFMKILQFITMVSLFIVLPLSSSAQTTGNNDEQEIFSVLDDFMSTFSNSDPAGHAATYHVPHFRLARGSTSNWETREDVVTAHIRIFGNLSNTDWHHSEWVEREIISISDAKAHVATTVRRFREDGSEIVTFESLYILIKVEGRWGIKFRSSFL